jgi:hypothetical protein
VFLLIFSHVGIDAGRAVEVTTPFALPPGTPQVWNCARWQTISIGDFCGENPAMKALKPIELRAARNGVASGYVVVSRDNAPISRLKATTADFAQAAPGKGTIPATHIQIRYADQARYGQSWAPWERFDRLLESAPAEIPAVDTKKLARLRIGWKAPAYAPKHECVVATMPVWLTVRVPPGAMAGEYQSVLVLTADGINPIPVTVPVRLQVYDWLMPDPKDFRVRTIGWMNPEALANHYQTPLWSDRHFDLMGQSMERMLKLGSRHIQINVTKGYSAHDNADTMVKWVRQEDGSFKYDFTLFEKYCDLAAQKIGKPFPVRLNIWHGQRRINMGTTDDHHNATVLVMDPATGKTSELAGPTKLGSPEMKAFWKPVLDELRIRLEKRGWFDVAGCNWFNYSDPLKPQMAEMVRSIWPDGKWLDVTHGRYTEYGTTTPGVKVPVFVHSTVWREGSLTDYMKWTAGPYPRKYAGLFDPATAWCAHQRNQYSEASSLWTLRTRHEEVILKGNAGLEIVGADMFPIPDTKGGWRNGQWTDYAQGPGNATLAMLGAGDDGPLGTERFEAMREGIQLCEVMVFVQKALEDKKINGDLASRANTMLDDRAKALVGCLKDATPDGRYRTWTLNLDAYAIDSHLRDHALYAIASEVAQAIALKETRTKRIKQ